MPRSDLPASAQLADALLFQRNLLDHFGEPLLDDLGDVDLLVVGDPLDVHHVLDLLHVLDVDDVLPDEDVPAADVHVLFDPPLFRHLQVLPHVVGGDDFGVGLEGSVQKVALECELFAYHSFDVDDVLSGRFVDDVLDIFDDVLAREDFGVRLKHHRQTWQ